ncbi:glutamyl-tRNA reductase [Inhella gelatinilytica]|uniref:Glutamyl-tRNA reductase n=1 Tax=Inhella gelatinilytica TaxID=2795030 RepID=A0A931NEF9_9BURK|nr:glutamyl-tRNA reductase [Inhella gelatinilytica]MBH9552471.1 glutamyl-tRNA reductase [Inhella gelatinilytica]
MSVFTLGLNHASAPLSLREKLAFSPDQLVAHVQTLQKRLQSALPGAPAEAALLSTCNRTEVYVAGAAELSHLTLNWMAEHAGLAHEQLVAHTYLHADGEAARHAFRVASGLNSMVLGETQILGQFKQAVREADAAGTLGATLHQLFQRSFQVAKEVRTSTEIGAHSISMAAAAVRLAGQLFEDLRQIKVLFIGAGEMIQLAATHFAAQHPASLVIANRTASRAEHLAHNLGGRTLPLSEVEDHLHLFDAVISCTGSPLPLILRPMMERALKARRRRPMFLVDLAVPRDIEASVGELDDAYLYSVDDLAALVQTASDKRQAAVAQAEAIVDHGVQAFAQWLSQRHSVPLIQALQHQMEDWRQQALAKARRQLHRGDSPEAALDSFAHQFSHKLMHGLLVELHTAQGEDRAQLERLLQRLFLRSSER